MENLQKLLNFRTKSSVCYCLGYFFQTLLINATICFFVSSQIAFADNFEFPKPSGNYAVGSQYFHFIDTNRPEIFTETENDFREVTAQVWYPATPAAGAKPKPYREAPEAALLSVVEATYFGLLVEKAPTDLFNHFSEVSTWTYLNAPLAKAAQSFPVLVYSHGIIGGHVTTHTALMEELASHGYIVFSISHGYQSPYVKYPDGSIKTFSPAGMGIRKSAAALFNPKAGELYKKLYQTENLVEQKSLIAQIAKERPFLEKSVRIWAEDILFTIDELEKLNKGKSMFAGKLDLGRIGVLGWSFGGAASGQACLMDNRCKAGINIDGLPVGDLAAKKMAQPFMFMRNGNRKMAQHFVNNVENDVYVARIQETSHFDFTDMTLYNIPQVNKILGSIDGKRAVYIVNQYVRAFFDKHLKGKDAPLLAGTSEKYPEVAFRFRARLSE